MRSMGTVWYGTHFDLQVDFNGYFAVLSAKQHHSNYYMFLYISPQLRCFGMCEIFNYLKIKRIYNKIQHTLDLSCGWELPVSGISRISTANPTFPTDHRLLISGNHWSVTGGFPTHKYKNMEVWCFLCCNPKQAVERIATVMYTYIPLPAIHVFHIANVNLHQRCLLKTYGAMQKQNINIYNTCSYSLCSPTIEVITVGRVDALVENVVLSRCD